MNNLDIYERVRTVPADAQKKIMAGRTKGFTDINPMWRIKILTEQFGPCGIGWYYTIEKMWLDKQETGEVITNILINLYIKNGENWSAPIQGIGGNMQVAKETKGMYVSDESYKMALTDAISVACKALGIGADVYWGGDRTKYNTTQPKNTEKVEMITKQQLGDLIELIRLKGKTVEELEKAYNKSLAALTKTEFEKAVKRLWQM